MLPSASHDTTGVELLLDRYATSRMGPDAGQLARGRTATLTAFIGSTSLTPAPRAKIRILRGWSLAATFALLLVGAGSIVAAESDAGEPFYGLRLAIGSVTLPGDEPAHQRGLASQLDDRLSEVRAAARNGDGQGAQAAIGEYLHTLTQLTDNGIVDPAILALLQRHHDTLEQLLPVAPTQAADGMQQALDAAGRVDGSPPAESTVPHPTPAQGPGDAPPATGKP